MNLLKIFSRNYHISRNRHQAQFTPMFKGVVQEKSNRKMMMKALTLETTKYILAQIAQMIIWVIFKRNPSRCLQWPMRTIGTDGALLLLLYKKVTCFLRYWGKGHLICLDQATLRRVASLDVSRWSFSSLKLTLLTSFRSQLSLSIKHRIKELNLRSSQLWIFFKSISSRRRIWVSSFLRSTWKRIAKKERV